MYKPSSFVTNALIAGIFLAIIDIGVWHDCAGAQPYYTPGNNVGNDWHYFGYAPFAWEYSDGMQAYVDHVHGNTEWTTGQRYAWEDGNFPTDWSEPYPEPYECTLPIFEEILGSCSDDIGTLLIQSHGETNRLIVEVYSNSTEGVNARDDAYDVYLAQYSSSLVVTMEYETPSYVRYPCIGVTDSYLRSRSHLDGALVFVDACYSSSIIDDLVNPYYGNARVAIGVVGEQLAYYIGQCIEQFFSRMDGKLGQWCRPVSCAKTGLNNYLAVAGQENTVLTVAVQHVDYPAPIRLGDTISITFDTKCNTYAWPEIWCDWWGDICEVGWDDDSLTFRATLCQLPPSGISEVEATLGWDHVWSGRNWACLDGNTDPWVGGKPKVRRMTIMSGPWPLPRASAA
jgi:hypothetical protein